MSTQLSLKSTVRRSSRLNPTFKKKLGFQKLEIEFISKSKKRSRNDSKVSPVLFDSPDDVTEKSQKINQSKLDVKFTKFSVKNGDQLEDVDSQAPITLCAYETTQFTDAVSQSSIASPLDDIVKFVNSGLNSQDFSDEIKKFANEGLNSQNFAVEMKKLSNEVVNSLDFANAIKEFANDSLNSQDFADAIEKFANDGPKSKDFADAIEKFVNNTPNSQDFADEIRPPNDDLHTQDLADEMKKLINEDLNYQDFADEMIKFTDPYFSSQNFAAPCLQNIESEKAKVQTALKLKPVRNQQKAPFTICDGNILPEIFRKSTARASKKPVAVKCVTQKKPKLRNKNEPVVPCETNASFEPAKNLQPVSDLKRKKKRGTNIAAKPAKRKSRNTFSGMSTLFEPLKVEVISQKTVPCEMNVSFEPAKNLQPISEQKRGRKPRTSVAAQSAKRKSPNNFSDMSTLLEPLNSAGVSQKTVPCRMNISFEPAKNLPSLCEQKRGRKPRTSSAAKPVKRKSRSTFPAINSLLEPLKIETASQKTWPCSRKPTPGKPVVIRRTRLSDKRQTALESAEMELCSLFSNCSVKSAEETLTPCVGSKSEMFNPRQHSNVGTTAFVNLSLSDLYKKDTHSANADDLSDFSDLFSMTLNVGNFSENLNIMSLLRQVTKIEKKLPHFVPPNENWYEKFEIW